MSLQTTPEAKRKHSISHLLPPSHHSLVSICYLIPLCVQAVTCSLWSSCWGSQRHCIPTICWDLLCLPPPKSYRVYTKAQKRKLGWTTASRMRLWWKHPELYNHENSIGWYCEHSTIKVRQTAQVWVVMEPNESGKRETRVDRAIPCFTRLHRHCLFFKLKDCGNPASSKCTSIIFPTFSHFMSVSHSGKSHNISYFLIIIICNSYLWSIITTLKAQMVVSNVFWSKVYALIFLDLVLLYT